MEKVTFDDLMEAAHICSELTKCGVGFIPVPYKTQEERQKLLKETLRVTGEILNELKDNE